MLSTVFYYRKQKIAMPQPWQAIAQRFCSIRIWNGTVCCLKTIQCKSIMYNDELVSEFGDIILENGTYKFMTLDNEEVILEITADDILEVDR
mgnify:CR=1 FL=1